MRFFQPHHGLMNELPTANGIAARAKAIRVPMYRVCERAGVSKDTFSNWKRGKTDPQMATVKALLESIEAFERERNGEFRE